MISFIFILFIILNVNATYHLTIVLVSAPKKIPMLTYTIEYIIHAYEYNKGDIIIDGVFIGKGCDCDYPDVSENVELLNKFGIPAFEINMDKQILDSNSDVFKNAHEYYSNIWHDIHQFRHPVEYVSYYKGARVTYFFDQLMDAAKKQFPNFDYLLTMEDDVASPKDFFIKLTNEMNKKYDNEFMIKTGFQPYHRLSETHWKLPRDICVWGYYGNLFNQKQLNEFLRFRHYQIYVHTGDLYPCEVYRIFDKSIRMSEIVRHFGHDKRVKRRDPKFWD